MHGVAQPFVWRTHHTDMVMIAHTRPTPGYILLAPDGKLLGRVDLPLHPDLLAAGTVLLRRMTPA